MNGRCLLARAVLPVHTTPTEKYGRTPDRRMHPKMVLLRAKKLEVNKSEIKIERSRQCRRSRLRSFV